MSLLGAVALGLLAVVPPGERPEFPAVRATGPIAVDGELGDAGWQGATRLATWYEVEPGDNVEPPVRSLGLVAYDDQALYVGFDLHDPDPRRIRAPFGDRDGISSDGDFAGLVLDTRGDGRTALEFFANPRGIQFDAVVDDATGNEDPSPDLFWQSAARIHATGWTLELRIPFSSLRYPAQDPRSFGLMLFRNYPRAFRYQIFTSRLPRGGNCFVCRAGQLAGLQGLPRGGHGVLAPYASARHRTRPAGDVLGAPQVDDPLGKDVGFDLKWTPTAAAALDATLNPDFSQVESDVAQIGANERFALFYPEKRPFFLEGIELFATPLQAVYTRTITDPRLGVRGTGRLGSASFTALLARDEGGGSVILPGSNGSELADQDFRSYVAIGRVRRSFGGSFGSFLVSDRHVQGGGFNLVAGPDFQWRPDEGHTLTGQFLLSSTRAPQRPVLAEAWDGRKLDSYAADLSFNRSSRRYDLYAEARSVGEGFRADNGFVPQAGYRDVTTETGWTFRPQRGFLRRLRPFALGSWADDAAGRGLSREASLGAGMDGRLGFFLRTRYAYDRVLAGDRLFGRHQWRFDGRISPSRVLSRVAVVGFVGQDVDFEGGRPGSGAKVSVQTILHPHDRLELRFNDDRRVLNVDTAQGRRRLFTASVDRLRATWSFSSRAFLRLIGQHTGVRRDPTLFEDAVARRSGSFTGSALFAYKLDWQTVLFAGFGDVRTLDDAERYQREDRQAFLKISYAWQM